MAVWTTSAALPLIVVGGVGGGSSGGTPYPPPPRPPAPLPLPLRRTLRARHSPLCARRCADSRTRAARDPRADSVPPFPPPAMPQPAAARLRRERDREDEERRKPPGLSQPRQRRDAPPRCAAPCDGTGGAGRDA